MRLPLLIIALTPMLACGGPWLASTAIYPSPPSTSWALSNNGVSESDKQKALQIAGKVLTNTSHLPDSLTVDTLAIIALDSMLDKSSMKASSMQKHGKELARIHVSILQLHT